MRTDLAWRIELVCRDAWPALEQIEWGDWLLRCSGGESRRANSANPLRHPAGDIDAALDACEAFYRKRARPALFRIPSLIERDIDAKLDSRNYQREGETATLFGSMEMLTSGPDGQVEISAYPTVEWLAAMHRSQRHSELQSAVYGRIVCNIGQPAGFAALRSEGQLASLAIGVIRDGLLCFESVVTDERYRGRGFARRVLTHLIAWAARQGADGCCLQVVANNAAALHLYHGLGLKTEVYRYHYRREPKG